jgi:hypothetical protein
VVKTGSCQTIQSDRGPVLAVGDAAEAIADLIGDGAKHRLRTGQRHAANQMSSGRHQIGEIVLMTSPSFVLRLYPRKSRQSASHIMADSRRLSVSTRSLWPWNMMGYSVYGMRVECSPKP